MRKLIIYIVFLCIPLANNARVSSYEAIKTDNNDIYSLLNLAGSGLSKDVFLMAVKGMGKLEQQGLLHNSNLLTIADYSQSSNKKRLYVIDLANKKLLFNTYVAHGRNSGDEFAKNFSNDNGSLKSSLGFFITEQPIMGSHTGFSLQIKGLEKGFNDNALQRAIIIHSAEYATENFIKKNGRLGRSYGCPVLPPDMNKAIIETIKGGSCLFIYHPDKHYISSSDLLN
ncbi:MAG: murein L,D-transpeptidase catalytic domain family protein [Bacteroidetes bacterium]|nr:murein L,D-transpeptidase catalytic domain family protein [Bacteroidota bacterium]